MKKTTLLMIVLGFLLGVVSCGGDSGGGEIVSARPAHLAGVFLNPMTAINNTVSVALGDVDGDGDLDLVVGNEGQANTVWISDGEGTHTDSGQFLGTSDTWSVVLGDVDGDGDLDLVAGNANEANTVWETMVSEPWCQENHGVRLAFLLFQASSTSPTAAPSEPDRSLLYSSAVWRRNQRSVGAIPQVC